MEGFTYVDIFATKGIEYLLVISGLLLFTFFWRFLSRPAVAVYRGAERIIPAISDWFHLPEEGMYFHQGHSWAVPEDRGLVRVGMDDFAQKLVGKIDAIRFPQVGSQVTQGEKAWSLLVGPKSIDMLSPVDGEILDINENLVNSPESINKDPYGHWLMKVQTPKTSANLKNLLSGKLAKKWMEEVRENLLARMNYNLGAVYQDGGVPVDGIARNLDREKWDEIVKEFFIIPQKVNVESENGVTSMGTKSYPLIPEDERKCIWMTTGLISYKLCDRNYECEICPFDKVIRG